MNTDRLDTALLERELVLACIARPDLLDDLRCVPGEFCDRAAGTALSIVQRIHGAGEAVNALTVQDALQASGDKPAPWVAEPSWVEWSGGKLKEFHERVELRRTRDAALALVSLCESGKLGDARIAAQDCASVQDGIEIGTGPRILTELARESAQDALDASRQQTMHLGLSHLQEATGGLLPGNMVVVGADTGTGKSSYVLAMALAMARHHTVGIVSCEDAPGIWGARAAAQATGVSSLRLITGKCRDSVEDSAALGRFIAAGNVLPIALDCQIGKPETDVMASMRRMAHAGAKVLIVDYVQTILCSNAQAKRADQVREIAARLKGQAAALGCGLVLVSQLRRPGADQKGREPGMHDLKETGDLENAAELIVLLWRPDPEQPDKINVKLEKGKWGATKRLHHMRRDRSGTLVESADWEAEQDYGQQWGRA